MKKIIFLLLFFVSSNSFCWVAIPTQGLISKSFIVNGITYAETLNVNSKRGNLEVFLNLGAMLSDNAAILGFKETDIVPSCTVKLDQTTLSLKTVSGFPAYRGQLGTPINAGAHTITISCANYWAGRKCDSNLVGVRYNANLLIEVQ